MQGPSMAADRPTPWWIRLNLGDDAGTADWQTPSWCRHDFSDDVAEHAHYAEAQRVARQLQYVWDEDAVIRAMAQLAAQDGETSTSEHVQAVFRDLLCEFRQQADCTAEFAAETDGSMLAAFGRRQPSEVGLHQLVRQHGPTILRPPRHGRSWTRSVQVAPATPTPTPRRHR